MYTTVGHLLIRWVNRFKMDVHREIMSFTNVNYM
jgi:hypothetical protein